MDYLSPQVNGSISRERGAFFDFKINTLYISLVEGKYNRQILKEIFQEMEAVLL